MSIYAIIVDVIGFTEFLSLESGKFGRGNKTRPRIRRVVRMQNSTRARFAYYFIRSLIIVHATRLELKNRGLSLNTPKP